MTNWTLGNAPTEQGWYAVMISGDSEYLEGHCIYDFSDYQTFAFWMPADPEEMEDFEGGYRGFWKPQHDEPPETIFAFFGPLAIPSFRDEPVTNGDETCHAQL